MVLTMLGTEIHAAGVRT